MRVTIAHTLSNICRYGGRCERFYSVAEHCVLLYEYCCEKHAPLSAYALLHDAAEIYIPDFNATEKHLYSYRGMSIEEVEFEYLKKVHRELGLIYMSNSLIDSYDKRIVADELQQNPLVTGPSVVSVEPLGVTLKFWPPEVAKKEWLRCYAEIVAQRNKTIYGE